MLESGGPQGLDHEEGAASGGDTAVYNSAIAQ